ncbi:argininosuccinate lyase [Treponema brennaborense]|uniref:Argininosuccinate lyase n=1 Tax=Treponema brennaborense (strain DSM 12168 / CIP 105900 / DD5/3) TaxID=906968 RepID=F4LJL9_TREBD|nr:argininosuccinate lyase [Treponema brennaborense]AEE16414.1 Argininosuccinate lyase [Treponema brennaborense DSM 12168]
MNTDTESAARGKGAIEGGNHAALWHGRFAEGPDAQAVAFETSIHVDERMAADDIAGSKAHAAMLGSAGIISRAEADAIVSTLDGIAADLNSGALSVDPSAEDIHSFVEGVLTDRLGETGKKVHTGRSRNDQIALDERLYLRHAVPDLQRRLVTLISVLNDIAGSHTETLLSGYTHLQRAQPVTLAHHVCAWSWMLVRDHGRLSDALKRINLSPLGAGALAASGLPLDREAVASALGFEGVTQNSLDTVADRDYCIEITAALSLLMAHLSRFCEEIIIWSTEEFKFIDLSEKWSTGSSIMPQKKNPDFAELIRGRTGKVYGDLIALLTMIKGLPLAYNRDMQEDKSSLFDAYDTALSCVTVFTHMIGTARWNTERMAASCTGGHANATDVADYLVRKGMPFRTAHGVAASAVRLCIERGCNIEDLPLADLQACSPLIEADLYACITSEACVSARDITGGPAPAQVKRQIAALRAFCVEHS